MHSNLQAEGLECSAAGDMIIVMVKSSPYPHVGGCSHSGLPKLMAVRLCTSNLCGKWDVVFLRRTLGLVAEVDRHRTFVQVVVYYCGPRIFEL
jgi:hypothetical protein